MITFVVATAMALAQVTAETPATFTVTIPADKTTVTVEASYAVDQPYLEMYEGWYSESVSGGLAGFVENLTVSRADGTPLTVEGPAAGRWRIGATAGEPITVRYTVRLDHEKQRWPFGVDEIAYTRGDCVFFVSRSILPMNDGVRASRVRFVLPENWRIVTPWRPAEGETNAYDVANRRHLAESCILAGDFVERRIPAGDTAVTLALGHELDPYADTLDTSLRSVVPAYAELFQDSPQLRFLAVVNAHASGGITDGSAYLNSVSMLTPRRMEGVNYDQAIYTIAHEVLHLWNGNRMRPAAQMEWFKEGFTDYVTWRTLAELHLVNETAVLRELKRQITAYLNQDRKVSIAAAGERKAENGVLVYEGGSLAALCLDALIRVGSGGERSIADFMREVYKRSALQKAPYDEAMIVAVAGEMAGKDMQPFFQQHVNGMEALPLEENLASMGLRIERKDSGARVSVAITPDESAKGIVEKARDAFLGRN